jgi:hypothetical protein
MNGIVILTPQSREKNLAIYLVFVREVPRFARNDNPSQRIYETASTDTYWKTKRKLISRLARKRARCIKQLIHLT